MGISNPVRTETANWMESTTQPTIVHFNQETISGHIDCNHSPLRSLDSVTDVPRYGRNIDNYTGMNPQGPIVTMLPEYNKVSKCNIFDSVIRTSYHVYREFLWHTTMKSENKNLM